MKISWRECYTRYTSPSIIDISLKNNFLKCHSNLSWANELKFNQNIVLDICGNCKSACRTMLWCDAYSEPGHWWPTVLNDVFVSLLTVFSNNLLARPGTHSLTHWGRDKMAAVFQTMFSIAFSWMKMFEFRLKFHLSLFTWVELTLFHHWFR